MCVQPPFPRLAPEMIAFPAHVDLDCSNLIIEGISGMFGGGDHVGLCCDISWSTAHLGRGLLVVDCCFGAHNVGE